MSQETIGEQNRNYITQPARKMHQRSEMKCQNPECKKEVPLGKKYCDENCLRRHIEIKKAERLDNEEDQWLGQERRKRAMETIQRLAKELLPMSYKKFACTISYRTGLSIRKVTDDYLEVLLEIGLLKREENTLILGGNSVAS